MTLVLAVTVNALDQRMARDQTHILYLHVPPFVTGNILQKLGATLGRVGEVPKLTEMDFCYIEGMEANKN